MKDKKQPIDEIEKISKEFQKAMSEFSKEVMKTMIPAIKEATENIKKLSKGKKLIENLELIQDEEEDGKT